MRRLMDAMQRLGRALMLPIAVLPVAGLLLRLLQQGEQLGMPQAELLPNVGARCGALRVRDAEHNWRIMYRADTDAVLVLEVYSKKTRKIPDEVIRRCQDRLKRYDAAVQAAKKK